MKLKPEFKGYAYIFLATVAGSTVYIFSKAALNEVSLAQFGVYWFAMAIVFNLLYTLRSPETRHFRKIPVRSLKILVMMGFVELVATGTFYASISSAGNPSIPSFLRNMEYVFVTILGVVLLSERFRGWEIAGVALTFTGAFVISYHKGGSLVSYLTGTSGLMLICTTFYAIRTTLAKTFIKTITPSMLAINRAIFLMTAAAIMLIITCQSWKIPVPVFFIIMTGSFLGPFLTSLGQYSALKYIEASRAAIIQSTTSLFVVVGVFLYFGQLPMAYQIAGGMLTVGGVVLLMVGRRRYAGRHRVQNSQTEVRG